MSMTVLRMTNSKKVEVGDGGRDEVADGLGTVEVQRVAVHRVDDDQGVGPEDAVELRPRPPGHDVAVRGLEPPDGDVVDGLLGDVRGHGPGG
jgi:hypothetical protein